jgi:hypothetical protein
MSELWQERKFLACYIDTTATSSKRMLISKSVVIVCTPTVQREKKAVKDERFWTPKTPLSIFGDLSDAPRALHLLPSSL